MMKRPSSGEHKLFSECPACTIGTRHRCQLCPQFGDTRTVPFNMAQTWILTHPSEAPPPPPREDQRETPVPDTQPELPR